MISKNKFSLAQTQLNSLILVRDQLAKTNIPKAIFIRISHRSTSFRLRLKLLLRDKMEDK